MNRNSGWSKMMASIIFSAIVFFSFSPSLSALTVHKQVFTGEVGDAMCGRQHMEGTPEDCTRTCFSKGSKFALVVGDKTYILETTDQAALATLDKQAGKLATVTGVLNGDTIQVSAVAAK